MTDNVFTPVDLSPELQKQSELKDLKWMREHESEFAYPVFKAEFQGVLVELNLRYMQYNQQFNVYSKEFQIFQTIQDFKQHLTPLQAKKLEEAKPIALVKQTKEQVYFVGTMFVIRE